MGKIIKSALIITLCLTTFSGATYSFFKDDASLENNVFSTGIWTSTEAVVINEVYYDTGHLTYDSGTKTEEEGKNEWIELYNPNTFAINIKNWSLTDNSNVAHLINANVSIPAHGYALLSHDNSTWHFWGDPGGANIITTNLGGDPGTGWLGNSGDRLYLKDALGGIIDSMSWQTDITVFNPACPDVAEGHSLERNPDGQDTGTATDFVDRITPTPGT